MRVPRFLRSMQLMKGLRSGVFAIIQPLRYTTHQQKTSSGKVSARFHHSGRRSPISAPSTVKSSQNIFLSIGKNLTTDQHGRAIHPKGLKHRGTEEAEENKNLYH